MSFFFFTPLHILAYLFFEIVLTNSSFISPSQNVVKSLLILSCREIIFIKVKQLFFFTTFYFTMSNWDNRHLFWQPTAKISSWWMVMTVLEKFFYMVPSFFLPSLMWSESWTFRYEAYRLRWDRINVTVVRLIRQWSDKGQRRQELNSWEKKSLSVSKVGLSVPCDGPWLSLAASVDAHTLPTFRAVYYTNMQLFQPI